jgi:SAM-dependent methyltransferase
MNNPDEMNSTAGGWEQAYRAQASLSNTSEAVFLWQEGPIPFLKDSDLMNFLRTSGVTRVLDAGAGDARNSFALEREGFFVVGLDIAPTAVRLAAERAVKEDHHGVIFLVGDITNLNIEGPFDLVVCADTIGQLDDPRPAIANFQRVLKPGGFLLFNLYSLNDGTYGAGNRIDDFAFEYKGCIFRYFTEEMAGALVADWEIVSMKSCSWADPPHGDFRPMPHTHDSFVVLAQKRGGSR